jgi:hypothetical protein
MTKRPERRPLDVAAQPCPLARDGNGDIEVVPIVRAVGERPSVNDKGIASVAFDELLSDSHATPPDGRLVAVPGAGHPVQVRAQDPSLCRILGRFLGG